MITDEQILQIASQHLYFYCNMSVVEWSGKSEDILNFARAIYEMGNDTLTISQPTSTISHEQSINRVER